MSMSNFFLHALKKSGLNNRVFRSESGVNDVTILKDRLHERPCRKGKVPKCLKVHMMEVLKILLEER